MRKFLCATLLVLAAGCAKPAPPPPPAGPAEDQITTQSLTDELKTLASDDFQGRAPATPGGQKTQDYLAKQMTDLGIAPGAPNGSTKRIGFTGYCCAQATPEICAQSVGGSFGVRHVDHVAAFGLQGCLHLRPPNQRDDLMTGLHQRSAHGTANKS